MITIGDQDKKGQATDHPPAHAPATGFGGSFRLPKKAPKKPEKAPAKPVAKKKKVTHRRGHHVLWTCLATIVAILLMIYLGTVVQKSLSGESFQSPYAPRFDQPEGS